MPEHTLQARIIPARAGPTQRRHTVRHPDKDHPRSCGANAVLASTLTGRYGSSPLVRGQRDGRANRAGLLRIIPARAGPTYFINHVDYINADHPRSCGANMQARHFGAGLSGSSPLVRGQRSSLRPAWPRPRIIPARAGPTWWPPSAIRRTPDHPRSCGANGSRAPPVMHKHGSSPLVRGQQHDVHQQPTCRRIIPARAGPTQNHGKNYYPKTDHPRSCGANHKFFDIEPVLDGSSPLVRGQLVSMDRVVEVYRIIPARAGPTLASLAYMPVAADHPRSCGANSVSNLFRN